MSDAQSHSARYCCDIVRAQDEDRWLAARYAPAEPRRVLLALYALHSELRRIPGAVSEPRLGAIRLQWWRDGIKEVRDGGTMRAHPVIEEAAGAGIAGAGFAAALEEIFEAAARLLEEPRFRTIDDLSDWLRRAEGAVDALAARLLGGGPDLADAAAGAGVAFALERAGGRLAPELKQAAAHRAGALWTEFAPGLARAPRAVAPAVLHLALTPVYRRRGDKPFPAFKRLKLFAAMASGRV